MRYALYTRKSTSAKDERQVQSIEDQQKHARRLVVERGLATSIEFTEACSAKEPYKTVRGVKQPAREQFARMISMVEDGEIDGIIAWHPDRLSRNEIDAANITHLLRTGRLKDLQFCQYTFTNSPEGIMMLQMALSQSQYYSSKLGTDVKRGMLAKIEKGWYPHHAPPGYLNNKHLLKGQKTISADPERFQTLRKAWDLLLSGTASEAEIREKLNGAWGYRSLGGKPLSKTSSYEIFSNVFYAGHFMHKGKLYSGRHPAMVTMDEFRRAQEILHTKMVRRPRKQNFAYTGMFRCGGCGGQLTAYSVRKPSGRSYDYYRCQNLGGTCIERNVSAADVDRQIDNYLARINVLPAFQEWAWEAYREWLATGTARMSAV